MKISATRFAILAALLFSLPASAEVEKFMNISEGKMQPFFRLKFTPPNDWVQDTAATKKMGMAVYVPKGKDFRYTPIFMYIMVSYFHDKPTLEKFIENANDYWRGKVKDTKIEQVASEKRANGMSDFQVYHYTNPSVSQQPFEMLAFGEDKDKDGNTFFVKIALAGDTQKALDSAEADYRATLRAH
jgi:hypothetical protein